MRPRLAPLLAITMFLSTGLAAQVPGSSGSTPGARIAGVVHDSLAGASLSAAVVQLVANRAGGDVIRSVESDAFGRFAIADVPDGRYVLGFLHPMLDSLGLDPIQRVVRVERGEAQWVDLAIPAARSIKRAICGTGAATDSSAVVVGVVRDAASHGPAAGATVTGQWLEVAIGRDGVGRRVPKVIASTARNGWFSLCHVPRRGRVGVFATRGIDTTIMADVDVPESGFVRRDLYLGTPAGTGRLRGTVTSRDGERPVAGALVGVAGGPEVETNERGEWVLANVPTGTRTLETRALGYSPDRRVVHVVDGAPVVSIELVSFEAVLDTVRVTASRFRLANTGFDERVRQGMGRYLTPEQIAQATTLYTSDLLKDLGGVRAERRAGSGTRISISGTFGRCIPNVYVDGFLRRGIAAEDIDTYLGPEELAGVELYASPYVPSQFQPADGSGCGSLVLWTRDTARPERRWTLVRRAMQGLGAALIGVGIAVLAQQM